MNIRVVGPLNEAKGLMDKIVSAVPGCGVIKTYDHEEGIALYCTVREDNQIVVGGVPSDAQVIEFCRTWRSKYDVSKYFEMDFDAANEILDRLMAQHDLTRILDNSGRKREYRYMFIDSVKCNPCLNCKHSWGAVPWCGHEDEPKNLHGDCCDKYEARRRCDE